MIKFTVYCKPQPQGSSKAFVIGGKARITSANKNLRPYRGEVTREAMHAVAGLSVDDVLAPKHVPVRLQMDFYFERPASIPKKRTHMVVKPDGDKLARATFDSLTGVLFHDDAQVVEHLVRKFYGTPERVEIAMQIVEQPCQSK